MEQLLQKFKILEISVRGHYSWFAYPPFDFLQDLHIKLKEEADAEGLAVLCPASVDRRGNVHFFLQDAAGIREKILSPWPGEGTRFTEGTSSQKRIRNLIQKLSFLLLPVKDISVA